MYRHPETLSDWILLMQAAKEEYGDLNVKLIAYDMSLEGKEYSEICDVIITGYTSLLKEEDEMSNEKTFVIKYD